MTKMWGCIGSGSHKDNCVNIATHGYWCLRCEKLRMDAIAGHELLTDTVFKHYYDGWMCRGMNGMPCIYIHEWFLDDGLTGMLHEYRNLRRWNQYIEADAMRQEMLDRGLEVRSQHKGMDLYIHYKGWDYVLNPEDAEKKQRFILKYRGSGNEGRLHD